MNVPIKTAIIGASGYGGAELLRLLGAHPRFQPEVLVGNSLAGEKVGAVYPHLLKWADLRFVKIEDCRESLKACRLVFCALPHGEAMRTLPGLENEVIVDFGGDFRLQSSEDFQRWYGLKHARPELLGAWAYGLPELFRAEIAGANRIANPGCYATAAILALAPLLKQGVVSGTLVVDAISGISGAGRTAKAELQFSQIADDIRAYKVGQHQHTPEIEMALAKFSGLEAKVSFTPHIVPAVRGIHACCSGELCAQVSEDGLFKVFEDAYAGEPFVKVTQARLGCKDVRGSNYVSITPTLDAHTGRVIVTCVLDNLVKGAAGQALQNANLRFGFDETLGLDAMGVSP